MGGKENGKKKENNINLEVESIKSEDLLRLITAVPDIGDVEETCITYWQKFKGKMIYLEGWADACLAGTGFPLMEEGSTGEKIDYIKDLSKEILPRKAKERGFKLIEGGFYEMPDATNLYGVTWGIFEKGASRALRENQQA